MLKKGGPKIAAANVSVAEIFSEMFEKNFTRDFLKLQHVAFACHKKSSLPKV